MPLVPVSLLTERCLYCSHVVTGLRIESVFEGMKAHVDFLNRYADKATDPHFADARLDRLIVN